MPPNNIEKALLFFRNFLNFSSILASYPSKLSHCHTIHPNYHSNYHIHIDRYHIKSTPL